MLDKAKLFAEKAHEGQVRKGTGQPYIVHPTRVAEILHQAGCSKNLICAGYLHDVVEDTGYEITDIEKEFGMEVADLVAAHTEDKTKSWQERKQHTIDTVKTASKDIKCLIIADKLDNLLSTEEEMKTKGAQVWQNFNAGHDSQKWYYESVANHMYDDLLKKNAPEFFRTYEQAVLRVFS
ncbi:phosphohydrolase [Thalassobacillus devorans]|uniref:Phosphohydrolase n=1 Tax=Thalassobacillus devorans TaxID=279813 RepID=A0ABQ1PFX2_9BACI|nr:HD domain-containing protein [Thalassobacillus devorans]NIK29397.1 (p)ppGpp synthase/HD superfamily hydrolase [Thalassobacillus devorans]GGC96352.1 phosphohydrolase [Thalassobacillus devorans]